MEDEDGYPVFEEEDCYPDSYIDVELESVGSKDTCRLRLAIYDEDMAGGFVQYKDQKERIPLYLNHSQTVEPGSGGGPDTRRLFYNEMRQGVADGEYVVTLRYPDVIEVYYLRGKEEREFMLKKQRNEKNCGLIECVAVFAFSALHAQRTKCLRITKKALDIGVYDYGKVKNLRIKFTTGSRPRTNSPKC